ncbi:MAG: hypothetical protein HOH81_09525 [Flavobacteriaceae bacterium]|nr:hypothetical protein [Flavobacteriaceae bacterium]
MNNQIMFLVGIIIFIIYVYFLLTIVRRQHKIQRKENMKSYDSDNLDGIRNHEK